MTKVCVTGSEGFIAKHLIRRLKSEGYEVIGIDLKTGQDIRELSPDDVRGVKCIFHLAAQAKIPLSIDQPEFTNDHNINGTLRVLMCAKEVGAKVIYSASSSAYGNQKSLPLFETMKTEPLSPYGLQKLVGEEYCRVFSAVYGLETVSLRYFNVYGENCPVDSPYASCIARFLDFNKKGQVLPIYGGSQTRDFTYVGDVVEANILAMKSDRVGKGEVINIGAGSRYSIEQVAETISSQVVRLPMRQNEIQDTLADISKAKELLNWEPKTNLLEWLKRQLQNN